MLRRILPVLFVLSALFLFACAKQGVAPTNDAGPEVARPTGDKVGVPECDDYLAKYDACVSGKVPELARAQYKTALDQTRKSWQQIASTPQGKATLAAACQKATEDARTSMKSFNCTF